MLTKKERALLASAELGAPYYSKAQICEKLAQVLQTLGRVREMLDWIDSWLCAESGVYRGSYEARAVDAELANCHDTATD